MKSARLEVMANADTPRDAARAREYGAKGIGLCRTERMFNDSQRLPIVQDMILADTPAERRAALDKLLPIQRADFKGIFAAMKGLPVTVRLLDPPMHEFLPTASQLEFEIGHLRNLQRAARSVAELPDTLKLLDPELPRDYVESLGKLQQSLTQYREAKRGDAALERREAMLKKVHLLSEVNPMLGHRGVRLGLSFPEIYEMQIRAMLEAAAECTQEGIDVRPEIMVPQVCAAEESCASRRWWTRSGRDRGAPRRALECKFGTMVEVVRACMRAARPRGGRRVLLVRHQRPHAGDLLLLARGCREQVPAAVHRSRRPAGQPVRDARRRRRGAPDAARGRLGTRRAARTSSSASAASTAGSRRRSGSATTPGSTTSRARHPACPSRGSRRRRRRSGIKETGTETSGGAGTGHQCARSRL